MVRELSDITVPEEQVVTNFTILGSFVQKHSVTCLNVIPAKQKVYEEAVGEWITRKCLLDDPLRAKMLQLIAGAYQASAAGLLQNAHSRLLEQEKVNTKLRVNKGTVDTENEEKHTQLREALQKLQTNLGIFSEYLNQPLPQPQEEDPTATRITGAVEEKVEEEDPLKLWEDAEQQKFYEELPDLKEVIPAVLLNPTKGQSAEEKEEDKGKVKDATADKANREEARAQAGSDFELYCFRLMQAEAAKQVDNLIIEFFHDFNTKGNRRLLAVQLLSVPRTALHVIPALSRFMAVTAPYMKEVPNYVLSGLQQELEQLVNEKDPVAIESKVRTVRYLCELCKFQVCPPGVVLDMLKTFCDDFSQHHAELCAHILTCCGRFLLYTATTSQRTENLLERMMRLKNVKSLHLRTEIMLEDAYYQMKPPEGKRKVREKDPLELFTQHLIFERLYKDEDEDKVLKLVRKLPWVGSAPDWLKKCILELNMHANYESLYQLASLLSGLAKYHDAFVIDVIDALLENIQVALERNDFREMPLRVRQSKLLGELYNYRLVDSNLVFDTMYHFIGFGGPTTHKAGQTATVHKIIERSMAARKTGLGSITEEAVGEETGIQLPPMLADPQHPMEPPWEHFRIKLVCVVLDTCGHYFDRGAVKQKLERFLQFFVRHVHTKPDLPMRILYMVYDTLERLRPKTQFAESKAEADVAILKILKHERENLDLGEEEEEDRFVEEDDDASSSEDESDSEESDSSDDDDSDDDTESEEETREDMTDYRRGEGNTKHTQEIDDFDREMQQMRIEALEREKNSLLRGVLSELPPPPPSVKRADTSEPGVFNLLQKKTGKTLMRQIEIPEDSKLVRVSRAPKQEVSEDHEEVKRYIMNYEQMSTAPGGPTLGSFGIQRGKGGHKGGNFRFNPQRRSEGAPEDDRGDQRSRQGRGRGLEKGGGRGRGARERPQ